MNSSGGGYAPDGGGSSAGGRANLGGGGANAGGGGFLGWRPRQRGLWEHLDWRPGQCGRRRLRSRVRQRGFRARRRRFHGRERVGLRLRQRRFPTWSRHLQHEFRPRSVAALGGRSLDEQRHRLDIDKNREGHSVWQPGLGQYQADDSIAVLSGFPANQSSIGVVHLNKTLAGNTHEVELLLRFTISAHDAHGYECNLPFDEASTQIVSWNGPPNNHMMLSDRAAPRPQRGGGRRVQRQDDWQCHHRLSLPYPDQHVDGHVLFGWSTLDERKPRRGILARRQQRHVRFDELHDHFPRALALQSARETAHHQRRVARAPCITGPAADGAQKGSGTFAARSVRRSRLRQIHLPAESTPAPPAPARDE